MFYPLFKKRTNTLTADVFFVVYLFPIQKVIRGFKNVSPSTFNFSDILFPDLDAFLRALPNSTPSPADAPPTSRHAPPPMLCALQRSEASNFTASLRELEKVRLTLEKSTLDFVRSFINFIVCVLFRCRACCCASAELLRLMSTSSINYFFLWSMKHHKIVKNQFFPLSQFPKIQIDV